MYYVFIVMLAAGLFFFSTAKRSDTPVHVLDWVCIGVQSVAGGIVAMSMQVWDDDKYFIYVGLVGVPAAFLSVAAFVYQVIRCHFFLVQNADRVSWKARSIIGAAIFLVVGALMAPLA